jgi:hypothetical protein
LGTADVLQRWAIYTDRRGTTFDPPSKKIVWGTRFMAPALLTGVRFSLDRSVTVRHETKRLIGGSRTAIAALNEPGDVRQKIGRDSFLIDRSEELPET